MSIQTSITLASLSFHRAQLEALLASPQGDTGKHISVLCREVEGEAKRLTNNQMVNVQTGRLSGSITHIVVREGREVVGYVGSNVEYAPYVHEGTRNTKPRPFLTTALDTVMGR